jgi:HPt (histidine-containing phosphotransfer) domain-containing protein
MPELDGYRATAELRRREGEAGQFHMPIVALTANALDGSREQCLVAGMDDHLTKPIRLPHLVAMLRRYLPTGTGAPICRPPTTRASVGTGSSGSRPKITPAALEPLAKPILDPAALRGLLMDLGDPAGGILGELRDNFRAQAGQQVSAIAQHATAGVMAGVASSAHGLKGQALTLGLTALAALAAHIEHAAASGRLHPGGSELIRLPVLFGESLAALERYPVIR